jgi:hypothetical protein
MEHDELYGTVGYASYFSELKFEFAGAGFISGTISRSLIIRPEGVPRPGLDEICEGQLSAGVCMQRETADNSVLQLGNRTLGHLACLMA